MTTAPLPSVSVVMPLLNEADHLERAVSAIMEQRYAGELEVILAVGPGSDDTMGVAQRLAAQDPRIVVVENPTGRTPDALNAALAAARHEVVVRVDGHGFLSPGYITTAVHSLEQTGAANVGGVMAAVGQTPFEKAVAAAMRSRLGVGGASFHTGGDAGPAPTVYLGVFRRDWLTKVDGYDRRFDRAQDWELNHRIRSAGGVVWFDPELSVEYRPRGTIRSLAKQYLQYGRWRRVVASHHDGTISARYLAPPVALVACAAGLVGGFVWAPLWVVPATYAASVTVGGLTIGRAQGPAVAVRVPAALATMHGSWAWGFLTSRPAHLLAKEKR